MRGCTKEGTATTCHDAANVLARQRALFTMPVHIFAVETCVSWRCPFAHVVEKRSTRTVLSIHSTVLKAFVNGRMRASQLCHDSSLQHWVVLTDRIRLPERAKTPSAPLHAPQPGHVLDQGLVAVQAHL